MLSNMSTAQLRIHVTIFSTGGKFRLVWNFTRSGMLKLSHGTIIYKWSTQKHCTTMYKTCSFVPYIQATELCG